MKLNLRKEKPKEEEQQVDVTNEQREKLFGLRLLIRRIKDMEDQVKKKRILEKSYDRPTQTKTELEFVEELDQLKFKREGIRQDLELGGIASGQLDEVEKESLEGFGGYETIT